MKIICDLRTVTDDDGVTDDGCVQKIESALRDRIGKYVVVTITVKRKPRTIQRETYISGGDRQYFRVVRENRK